MKKTHLTTHATLTVIGVASTTVSVAYIHRTAGIHRHTQTRIESEKSYW